MVSAIGYGLICVFRGWLSITTENSQIGALPQGRGNSGYRSNSTRVDNCSRSARNGLFRVAKQQLCSGQTCRGNHPYMNVLGGQPVGTQELKALLRAVLRLDKIAHVKLGQANLGCS